ncbi:MAG: hypothetical protein LQ349_008112 [Xanthoria aureola]|nr:MAG: hypothetical protein LQ349_008112 [Xanthoria aureola]
MAAFYGQEPDKIAGAAACAQAASFLDDLRLEGRFQWSALEARGQLSLQHPIDSCHIQQLDFPALHLLVKIITPKADTTRCSQATFSPDLTPTRRGALMPSDVRSREPLEEVFQSPFQDDINEQPKVRLPGHRGNERRIEDYGESLASIPAKRMQNMVQNMLLGASIPRLAVLLPKSTHSSALCRAADRLVGASIMPVHADMPAHADMLMGAPIMAPPHNEDILQPPVVSSFILDLSATCPGISRSRWSSTTWTTGGNGAVASKTDRKVYVHLPMTKEGKSKIRLPDTTILAEGDGGGAFVTGVNAGDGREIQSVRVAKAKVVVLDSD